MPNEMGSGYSAAGRTISLSPAILPTHNNIEFRNTAFFQKRNASLPSPEDVRRRNHQLHPGLSPNYGRPPPVVFPELNMIVNHAVPVPEIYGWQCDGKETFLYLELVDGDTLDSRWEELPEGARLNLCAQLHNMAHRWRHIGRGSSEEFVGNINGSALRDMYLQMNGDKTAGPFDNVKSFHDWLSRQPHWSPATYDPDDPCLAGFWIEQPVVFTHGDLHRKNILISRVGDGPSRIVAVIDWHQSGWYPRDWEYLKTTFTTFWNSEWAQKYVPLFIEPCSEEYALSFEFVKSFFGC